jgi:hypothetical protein
LSSIGDYLRSTEALVWLLVEQTSDEITALPREILRKYRLLHKDVHKEALLVLRDKWRGSHQHLVHKYTEMPDVLLYAVPLLSDHLGREVLRIPLEH